MSFQTIEHAGNKNRFSEDVTEKSTDLLRSAFFAESRIEENSFEQIE